MSVRCPWLIRVVLTICAALLSGCPVTKYSGDGVLLDSGAAVASDRYVLDLGVVDLTRRDKKTFRIAGLPKSSFVVGLEINAAADQSALKDRSPNATVSISLLADGKVGFSRTAPLRSWTWSVPAGAQRAFVYGREEPATYFDARSTAEYTLTVEVVEPDQSGSQYAAKLLAKSGGWK
jgi:hypothetical protein